MTKSITLRLPDAIADVYDEAARELGSTRSATIATLLEAIASQHPEILTQLEPPERTRGRPLGAKNKPKPLDAAEEMC